MHGSLGFSESQPRGRKSRKEREHYFEPNGKEMKKKY
jgi:hypothetical protein